MKSASTQRHRGLGTARLPALAAALVCLIAACAVSFEGYERAETDGEGGSAPDGGAAGDAGGHDGGTSTSTGTTTSTSTTTTGTTGTGTSCDSGGGCQSCVDCASAGPCEPQYGACLSNQGCVLLDACLAECAPNDQPCVDTCVFFSPDGVDDYEALLECWCATCAQSCAC